VAFRKGQSGNPGGRPKQKEFRDALNLALKRADGDKRFLNRVAESLVAKAVAGDVSAIREIADRIDGKPAQAVTGEDGGPLQHTLAVSWLPPV
jgi:hypothetical protein